MFGGSLNPRYFENPPALTYLLYVVFRLRFHCGDFRARSRPNPSRRTRPPASSSR